MTATQHNHDNTATGTAGKPKRVRTEAQKAARKAQQAVYRAENADARRAYNAKYRAENAEAVKAYAAKYRTESAEAERARLAKWRAENVEAEKARKAKWRAENTFGHAIPHEFNGDTRAYAEHLGYRSGFEALIARLLDEAGVPYEYEAHEIEYINAAGKPAIYTPDLVLGNGTIIEVKGQWHAASMETLRLVREQHPQLRICMVFQDRPDRIEPWATVSNATLCDTLGIPFAHKAAPPEWTANHCALSQ